MAKVDLLQVYVTDCPKCGAELLVIDAVRLADRIRCATCNTYSTVGSIVAKSHNGKVIHATKEFETVRG